MRRYRNVRYAPESLERKLSPSAVGLFPTSTHVPFVSQAAVVTKTSVMLHGVPSAVYRANVSGMGILNRSNIENPGGPTPPTDPSDPNGPTGPTNPTIILGN